MLERDSGNYQPLTPASNAAFFNTLKDYQTLIILATVAARPHRPSLARSPAPEPELPSPLKCPGDLWDTVLGSGRGTPSSR